jgi:hypothetical protein
MDTHRWSARGALRDQSNSGESHPMSSGTSSRRLSAKACGRAAGGLGPWGCSALTHRQANWSADSRDCVLSRRLGRVRVAGSFGRLLTAPNVHPRMGPHSRKRTVARPRTRCSRSAHRTENIHPKGRERLVNRAEWGATLVLPVLIQAMRLTHVMIV